MNLGSIDAISLIIFGALLGLLPLILLSTTAFLKIAVVLMLLRNALGTQQVPPAMALYAVALALAAHIMAPTFEQMAARVSDAGTPKNPYETVRLINSAAEPLKRFLEAHAAHEEREWFAANAATIDPVRRKDVDEEARRMSVLVPAFVVSEMRRGFEIAFLVYIPFVIIDIVVANVLMALGMQMVQPQSISTPLKLLLFVMIDGWGRLLHGLALSYS